MRAAWLLALGFVGCIGGRTDLLPGDDAPLVMPVATEPLPHCKGNAFCPGPEHASGLCSRWVCTFDDVPAIAGIARGCVERPIDGDPCNDGVGVCGDGVCKGRACEPAPVDACSTLDGCDDGDPCTVDECNGAWCAHTPRADGSACADGVCFAGCCGG